MMAVKRMVLAMGAGAALALALAPMAEAAPRRSAHRPPAAAPLVLDRVVLVMRHGVRPPTKAPAMPADVTPERWPDWPVQPGWLTPHGALAVSRLGTWDGARLRADGLIPARGCPQSATIRIVADSDQRTIATAQSWSAALAPGCGVPIDHKPQDEPDSRFGAIEAGLSPYDSALADAAVRAAAAPDGVGAIAAAHRPLLARLDAILCGAHRTGCGVAGQPTALVPAKANGRPKLSGALDRASTAAQILLLEYAEGKPLAQVGWGRASAADIGRLSAFHALEFRLLARPRYVASANFAGLAPIVREGLTGETRVTMISGHDTNVANLGGLLDVHWQVPGLAADDPSPGGALVLERLRAADGALFVRVRYRTQSLSQIRSAAALTAASPPSASVLPIAGCEARGIKGLCPLDQFLNRIEGQ
ncbi:histidine-type phosphatase [Novosphingobium sp. MD-1]|uniref:histidine-type phosphatase n=1 Tax=Novosphingobium sp. MD-1 TaxID=1630648 RepID=UPI00061BF010|nr:histidine-type phosphatase [Novosphingobium sp. MD-1]GAO53427.1 periplasmic phosphoanhydride phosphohydrolase [Novosphingobium sp. MD-1]